MSNTYPGYGAPYQGAPYQQGAGPYQTGAYGPQPAPQRRIDLLDVVEGVLTDGLSLSNFTRIARASGSKFWLGAAIGAGLVALAHRPEVKAAVGGVVDKARAKSAAKGASARTSPRAHEPAES